MVDISDAEAYAFAKNYSGAGNWLDEANSHDGVISGAAHTPGANGYFYFDGTDTIDIPDHANLDIGTTDAFTLGVAIRADDITPVSDETVIAKRVGPNVGYKIEIGSAGNAFGILDDNNVNINDAKALGGGDETIIFVRNVGDDDIEVFVDGVGSGSATADTTTASLANALTLTLGGESDGGDGYSGRIYSYAFIRQALTDAEVGTGTGALHDQLLNQHTGSGASIGWWGARAMAPFRLFNGLWRPDNDLWLPEGCLA